MFCRAVWGFYGHKGDSELALHYGFTVAPADNPFNCARVKSELELDSQKTALTSGMKQMLVAAMVDPPWDLNPHPLSKPSTLWD
jgi:hypothetical protein